MAFGVTLHFLAMVVISRCSAKCVLTVRTWLALCECPTVFLGSPSSEQTVATELDAFFNVWTIHLQKCGECLGCWQRNAANHTVVTSLVNHVGIEFVNELIQSMRVGTIKANELEIF